VAVEYASLVAAMAMLTATLTGAFGQKLAVLPSTSASAIQLVSSGAKFHGVPAREARAAYNRAPYSKPVLKYLYAAGWIGGKKSPFSCLFARVSTEKTVQEAVAEIRTNAKLSQQLRRRHVSNRTAANVLVAGIASACS
jgi:hypothetical protein